MYIMKGRALRATGLAEYLVPQFTVAAHDHALLRRELSRLEQNGVRDTDLSDIVEGRGDREVIELPSCPAARLAEEAGVSRYSVDVVRGFGIDDRRAADERIDQRCGCLGRVRLGNELTVCDAFRDTVCASRIRVSTWPTRSPARRTHIPTPRRRRCTPTSSSTRS